MSRQRDRRGPRRSPPKTLVLLVASSLVAGLLTAALVLPSVGSLGLLAKATGDSVDALPSVLYQPALAQHSVMLADDGSTIATLAGPEDRINVALTDVAPVMQQAIVAIEDHRFYEHGGVDVQGIFRALAKDVLTGSYSQGASTLTQQLVKNTLVETAADSTADPEVRKAAEHAATEKSLPRKLQEARYAVALEQKLTKDQILERYLNIVYFGEGAYGVEAAAQHYFNIPASKLTLPQAALLAGLVNSPSDDDPVAHPQAATDRRNQVIDALQRYDNLPADQAAAAMAAPLDLNVQKRPVDPCSAAQAPFFCAYVLRQLLADPKLGPTQAARNRAVYEGGLTIHTTWDARAQAAVDAQLKATLPNNIAPVAGVVVMEPGSGKVLAIGQNRDYGVAAGQTTQVFPTIRAEQVGSSFKAFTMTAALLAGIPLTQIYNSPACYIPPFAITGQDPNSRCPGGISNAGDSEAGVFNMVDATWFSVNTYFAQLELQVGIPKVAQTAKLLGIHSDGLDKVGSHDLSVTLGAVPGGLSVLDMATGYATLAAHGLECQPATIDSIVNQKGQDVAFSKPEACQQVIPASVADTVTSVLQGVLNRSGATAQGKGLDRPSAGKTGTLDNYKGAWFVGYVPQYATAVGIWNPTAPNNTLIPFCTDNMGCFRGHLYGGDVPASMWQGIMTGLVNGQPVEDFAKPQAADPGIPAPPKPSTSPSASPSEGGSASPPASPDATTPDTKAPPTKAPATKAPADAKTPAVNPTPGP